METEKKAAEFILGKTIAIPVRSPWYLRPYGKKLTVGPVYLGTLVEMSRLWLSMGIKDESENDVYQLVNSHTDTLCRILATGLLNGKNKIRFLAGPFSRYLKRKMTSNMLYETTIFILTYSSTKSFSNTIRLLQEMRMTAPRNLSPEDQGSQHT